MSLVNSTDVPHISEGLWWQACACAFSERICSPRGVIESKLYGLLFTAACFLFAVWLNGVLYNLALTESVRYYF